MSHKTNHGPVFRNHRGEHGARVTVEVEHHGWHGTYHFATHGKDRDQIEKMHDRIVAKHHRKAVKMEELRSLVGVTESGFTITDATVRDRGKGHELLCRAKNANGERVEWRQYFDDPQHMPTRDEVLAGMVVRVESMRIKKAEHADHLAEVRAALGLA